MHNCSMCLKPVNRCECGPGKVHEVTVQEMRELRKTSNHSPNQFYTISGGSGDSGGFVPPVEGAPVFVGYGAGGPRATLTPAGQELLKEIRAGETVDHPNHYNRGGIETIDYLESTMAPEAFKGFLQGNILKYMSRYPLKAGVEDLRKAQWYLERLITFKLKQGTPAK